MPALDSDNKLKTESFLRTVFKTFDLSSDGKISSEEVGRVLSALGRPQDEETRQNLVNKFTGGKKGGGKLDWSSAEFLRDVARYSVTDVSLIEESVYSAAFTTFDQVFFMHMFVCKSRHLYWLHPHNNSTHIKS